MTRYTKIKHVAAGLLQSFVSRNNDVGGFWALGVLYCEVGATGDVCHLNLLDGTAASSTANGELVAKNYAAFLRSALLAKGMAPGDLEEASVHVQFNASLPERAIDVCYHGDPFVCTVALRPACGKEARMQTAGRCLFNHVGRFSRRAVH